MFFDKLTPPDTTLVPRTQELSRTQELCAAASAARCMGETTATQPWTYIHHTQLVSTTRPCVCQCRTLRAIKIGRRTCLLFLRSQSCVGACLPSPPWQSPWQRLLVPSSSRSDHRAHRRVPIPMAVLDTPTAELPVLDGMVAVVCETKDEIFLPMEVQTTL